MGRKYELIKDDIKGASKVRNCYRIRALKDFGNIKKGDLGGYIESIHNLSNEGNCWVEDGAMVYGDAKVSGDAVIPKGDRFNEDITIHTTRGYRIFKWYRNTCLYKMSKSYVSALIILLGLTLTPLLIVSIVGIFLYLFLVL